jgi:hypothetical protein
MKRDGFLIDDSDKEAIFGDVPPGCVGWNARRGGNGALSRDPTMCARTLARDCATLVSECSERDWTHLRVRIAR